MTKPLKGKLDLWFTYHPPNEYQRERYHRIRESARVFAGIVVDNTPESIDQIMAIRKLREVVALANASIACED